ncbi:MAG: hypothetical protein F6K39_09710 [Okeania sp. SIO3B3]|nr:hypothetical protein [Okeania sp. SIO3B3]
MVEGRQKAGGRRQEGKKGSRPEVFFITDYPNMISGVRSQESGVRSQEERESQR